MKIASAQILRPLDGWGVNVDQMVISGLPVNHSEFTGTPNLTLQSGLDKRHLYRAGVSKELSGYRFIQLRESPVRMTTLPS